jgi:hypothetical protein
MWLEQNIERANTVRKRFVRTKAFRTIYVTTNIVRLNYKISNVCKTDVC